MPRNPLIVEPGASDDDDEDGSSADDDLGGDDVDGGEGPPSFWEMRCCDGTDAKPPAGADLACVTGNVSVRRMHAQETRALMAATRTTWAWTQRPSARRATTPTRTSRQPPKSAVQGGAAARKERIHSAHAGRDSSTR